MPLKFYMDQHVPRAITVGLRQRGLDVLTAFEDEADQLADVALLDRAASHGRILFTQDVDCLVEASARQQQGHSFAGIVYIHQLQLSFGRCINDLELLANTFLVAELADTVTFLPL